VISAQTLDVFKLQTELLNTKVDMAVSMAIDRVIEQINVLRSDMNAQIHELKSDMNAQIHEFKGDINTQIHELRHEMRDEFSSLKTRVTAVETKLGMVSESHKEVRTHVIEYCFKAGWLILGVVVSSLGFFLTSNLIK
jgi:hypothetical protein